jgi:ABC-type bacteriocin/lantibiotic exporter with double-glycine peptidase domain
MPQLPALDNFPYISQEEDSWGCVPACVAMVCAFLEVQKTPEEIERELDYSVDVGTPFENLALLSGVRILQVRSIEEAARELERGLPTIADLRIEDSAVLGYWGCAPSLHAVVLVGVEDDQVMFFDPLSLVQLSTCGPTLCSRASFERVWLSGWLLAPLK